MVGRLHRGPRAISTGIGWILVSLQVIRSFGVVRSAKPWRALERRAQAVGRPGRRHCAWRRHCALARATACQQRARGRRHCHWRPGSASRASFALRSLPSSPLPGDVPCCRAPEVLRVPTPCLPSRLDSLPAAAGANVHPDQVAQYYSYLQDTMVMVFAGCATTEVSTGRAGHPRRGAAIVTDLAPCMQRRPTGQRGADSPRACPNSPSSTCPPLSPPRFGLLMAFLRNYGYSAMGLNFLASALAMVEGART